MPKILLQCATAHHKIDLEFNKGSAAVLLCTIQALRKLIPEAEFISFIQLSESFSAQYSIKVVKNRLFSARLFSLSESLKSLLLFFFRCALWAMLHKYFHINVSALVNSGKLKHYYQADLIVELGQDLYNDAGGIIPVIEHSRDMLLGALLDKPVVVYASSPGPFRGRLARWLARFTLNRVSLITVREEISKSFLEEMTISKPPVYVTADPAFLLEPALGEEVKEILSQEGNDSISKPLIGIGNLEGQLMGSLTWSGYKNVLRSAYRLLHYCLPEGLYLWLMGLIKRSKFYAVFQSQHNSKTEESIAQIADHLVEKMGASVLLIPHVIVPKDYSKGEKDGRVIAEAIHRLVLNKGKVIPISGEYTAQEMKGIIGQCDLLVSLKMHPCIAAVSQCVPTIAIGSHQKFQGIMRMLGQERWVCDRVSDEDVIARIDDAWIHREEIREELKAKQETLREGALFNARLVKQLLEPDFHPSDKSPERSVS